MKKVAITIAIVLSFVFCSYAQKSGLFQRGTISDEVYYGAGGSYGFMDRNSLDVFSGSSNNTESYSNPYDLPGLPGHGSNQNESAPLGGGAFLLIGLGVTYALRKRKARE